MTKPTDSSCPKCGTPIPEGAARGLCPKCVLSGAGTFQDSSPAPGPRTPPPTVEEVAAWFPDLEILELVGAGGMGAVYKARQPKLDRLVALKILSKDLAKDPAFAERFNREARVLARLNHPNIVTVFDYGTKGPFFFLLMEYVDGVNLRQAMQAGEFAPSDSLALVQDICAALQFAHEEGILHRDIKPENILIDARGRVKIADFGIAKLMGNDGGDDLTLTAKGTILGSLHYMAPEQLERPGEVDQRADIYSLGVVFYELLTRELPIGRFMPPSEKTPMDPRIDKVVMRALEKERKLRYQTVGDVKTGVEAITQSHPTGKMDPGAGFNDGRKSTTPPSRPRAVGFAVTSTVLTGTSLFLLFLIVPALLFSPGTPVYHAWRGMSAARFGDSVWPLLIGLMFIVGVPALLGFIFGTAALGEIRESEGRQRGLGRAMFGTLTWPLLLLISLTSISTAMGFMAMFGPGLFWYFCSVVITVAAGVFVILSVWRWANAIPRGARRNELSRSMGPVAALAAVIVLLPTLGILVPWGMFARTQHASSPPEIRGPRPESFADVDWRLDRPEIELDLTIAPMHVATIAMVLTDASGKEETFNLEGWAIAPDERTFRGRVLIGSLISLGRNGKPRWTFCIELFGGTYIKNDGLLIGVGGATGRSGGGTLSGDWVFDPKLPNKLDLTTAGRHSMIVASPAKGLEGNPLSTDTLTLQVITQHRSGPDVPKVTVESGIIGGGSINWLRGLKD